MSVQDFIKNSILESGVFDGVSIDKGEIASVFLDVYYQEALNYEAAPYGTLRLYDHLSQWLPYSLSSADKKALQ